MIDVFGHHCGLADLGILPESMQLNVRVLIKCRAPSIESESLRLHVLTSSVKLAPISARSSFGVEMIRESWAKVSV